jgi:polysaccharide export outer membrane protein
MCRAVKKTGSILSKISPAISEIVLFVVCLVVMSLSAIGCSNKFWDPTQVGRYNPRPASSVILDSLGFEEEMESAWEGAEEPRPVDVIWQQSDNVFSAGDIVRISIFELLQESALFERDFSVSETGKISIPEVGVVDVEGLSESQLEEDIRNILSPDQIRDPLVTVTLLTSQRRAFSILGLGVGAPSRYFIPRYEFRLADALATAGGIGEFNVSNIFVVRGMSDQEAKTSPAEVSDPKGPRDDLFVPKDQLLEMIKPQAKHGGNTTVVTSVEMEIEEGISGDLLSNGSGDDVFGELERASSKYRKPEGNGDNKNGETLSVAIGKLGGQLQKDQYETEGQVEWVFRDGRWVAVKTGETTPIQRPRMVDPDKIVEPLDEEIPAGFGWNQIGSGGVAKRVIKIPVERFQSGDPRYNIVIRPGDTIYVPVDIIGEFYIRGNMNRAGAVPLTGRPITLKQAIAAAGDFGPLAYPKRCEVVRRIGKNREEIVMVDLDKIFSGEHPDFFIKVNDLINVGTHPSARWRAVLRNSFRASYGFGFIYDRNFADRDFLTHRPFPDIGLF